MFGIFKKKLSPRDDFHAALLSAFRSLKKADKLDSIQRIMEVSITLSSLLVAIRETHPSIPIDRDGAAMVIATAGDSPEGYDRRVEAVEFVLGQVRNCPNDDQARITVMVYFIAPRFIESKLKEMQPAE